MDLDAQRDAGARAEDRARLRRRGSSCRRPRTIDAKERFPREILRGLGDLGLMAVNVPPELGGAGAGVVAYALAMQEIARACASTAVTMGVTNMVGEAIARFGTDAQKQRYCPTPRERRVRARALRAERAGRGQRSGRDAHDRRGATASDWVLDGAKQWITGGALRGRLRRVGAHRRRRDAPGREGISCFLVEGGTPGLRVGRARGQDGHPRLEHRAARVRRRAASRPSALLGERERRLQDRDDGARRRAHRHQRRRRSASRARRSTRACAYAKERKHVRRAHRRAPGHPVEARRHADGRSTPRTCSRCAPRG